ncbi:hypothetical protein BDV12DRAFT_59229 [Aspergillus spectabilis]
MESFFVVCLIAPRHRRNTPLQITRPGTHPPRGSKSCEEDECHASTFLRWRDLCTPATQSVRFCLDDLILGELTQTGKFFMIRPPGGRICACLVTRLDLQADTTPYGKDAPRFL